MVAEEQTSRGANPELQKDLQVHLETLRELGPQYTDAVAASFLERVDRLIDARIEARLAAIRADRGRGESERTRTLAITLALGIPLTAIAGGIAGVTGVVIVWVALLLLNLRRA